MDGSGNALVSPVSIIPSPFSHSPGELDENETCHDQIAFRTIKSSQKSPSSSKHYMSPTISAASKAALPRKKILAERNGVPDFEQILYAKPFNLSPKMTTSPRCSTNGPINIKCRSSEPSIVGAKTSAKCSTDGFNDVQSSFVEPADDSPLKPYDPVTNYLSPRPQFLRYKPIRRNIISLDPENEAGKGGVGLDAKRGLSFGTQKGEFEDALGEDNLGTSVSSSEEDEETDNEKAEEDTQESSSVFSSVEDSVAVFSSVEDSVAVFSSVEASDEGSSVFSSEEALVKEENETIFNENAENYHVYEKMEEEEDDEIEVFEDERGWSLKGVSQFLFVIVSLIFSTHYISSMISPSLTDSPAVWGLKSQIQKFHFDMGSNFSESVVEPTSLLGKFEKGLREFDHREIDDGFEEEEFVIRDDNIRLVDITYDSYELEVEAQEMHTEDVGSKEQITGKLGLPNTESEVHKVQVLEGIDNAYDQMEVFEIEKGEEVSDELQANEAVEMYENENNSGMGSDDEKLGAGDGIEPVEEVLDQVKEDSVNNEVEELDTGKVESGNQSPESDSMGFMFPKGKLDPIKASTIIVPIIFTILASLGVVYYLRQKKVVGRNPVVEPLVVEPVLAENITSHPSSMKEEENDGAIFFASTSNLVHVEKKEVVAASDIRQSHSHSHSHSLSHHSHAPSVELLGELMIGEVSSSRRISHSNKDSFVEASEGFSHAKTTTLDLSVADSTTLDATSTAEKNKKGAEETATPVRRSRSKVLPSPSPVRRSSRLRDRSAMSP